MSSKLFKPENTDTLANLETPVNKTNRRDSVVILERNRYLSNHPA